MIKKLAFAITALLIGVLTLRFSAKETSYGSTQTVAVQKLKVSDSGRFLVTEDGAPFFWLGDTGWQLFSKLNREEVATYFQDRKDKGFNVIQAHVLDWDVRQPNAYGHTAFVDGDVDQPNERYWQHADFIVKKASELELYVALLPAWGRSHIDYKEKSPGSLALSPSEGYRYGQFIGDRFKGYNNIIWVLGGDVKPSKHAVYDSLAYGITEGYAAGNPDSVLMSYHPPGGTYRPPATSTGEFYHEKPWLDFNMIQSGHRVGNRNYERIYEDYQRTPVKPTLDAEPGYEQHPVEHKFAKGVFTAWHLRRRAYWSVLAGAFGFTYGGNGIWQMDKPGNIQKESHHNYYWFDALDFEGASDMAALRALFESRPFISPERVPDQRIIITDQGTVDDRLQGARARDFRYCMVYTTNGRSFEVDLSQLPDEINCWWYNPRDGQVYNGEYQPSHKPFVVLSGQKTVEFNPPGEATPENDWVLVLDDVTKNYSYPGANTILPR